MVILLKKYSYDIAKVVLTRIGAILLVAGCDCEGFDFDRNITADPAFGD